jgi:16S rRNA processing protein RimM
MNDSRGDEWIVLGVVAGAHGIGGEVRVFPYNTSSDNLGRADSLRVALPGSAPRRLVVERSRRHKKFFLLKLDGIDDRSAAEAARGAEVGLLRSELVPLEAGEVYERDLVGLRVETDLGGSLGEVREVFDAGETSVLSVSREGSREEHLIACTEDSLVRIDLVEQRIVVRASGVVTNR